MAKIVLAETEINAGWTFVRAELTPTALTIILVDDLGRDKRIDYMGPEGEALVAEASKTDFSGLNPSLDEWLLQRLIDDGHFAGVVEATVL